jgi:hypothetical protein
VRVMASTSVRGIRTLVEEVNAVASRAAMCSASSYWNSFRHHARICVPFLSYFLTWNRWPSSSAPGWEPGVPDVVTAPLGVRATRFCQWGGRWLAVACEEPSWKGYCWQGIYESPSRPPVQWMLRDVLGRRVEARLQHGVANLQSPVAHV